MSSNNRGTSERLLSIAKYRAKKKRLPFNIEAEDIPIPSRCPILGIPLATGGSQQSSPTVDRIIPELGYTKGNVIVISGLANSIKASGTPIEILKVATFYLKLAKDYYG